MTASPPSSSTGTGHGLARGAPLREAGHARLEHRGALLRRRRPVPRAQPARRGGRRLVGRDELGGQVADQRGGPGRRHRPGAPTPRTWQRCTGCTARRSRRSWRSRWPSCAVGSCRHGCCCSPSPARWTDDPGADRGADRHDEADAAPTWASRSAVEARPAPGSVRRPGRTSVSSGTCATPRSPRSTTGPTRSSGC